MDLREAVDAVLAESRPAGLKGSIDAALAAGASRTEVLRRVLRRVGRRSTLVLAVEAYLGADQAGHAPADPSVPS